MLHVLRMPRYSQTSDDKYTIDNVNNNCLRLKPLRHLAEAKCLVRF